MPTPSEIQEVVAWLRREAAQCKGVAALFLRCDPDVDQWAHKSEQNTRWADAIEAQEKEVERLRGHIEHLTDPNSLDHRMPEVNAMIAASREVTRAYNALFWGQYLSDEQKAEARNRLERALEDVVRVARDNGPPQPAKKGEC